MIQKQETISKEDAERCVIGSLLLAPERLDLVRAKINSRDFFDSALGKLFDLLCSIHDAGKPINDMTILIDQMRGVGLLNALGGVTGVAAIFQSVPHAAHVIYYANLVADAAALRRQVVIGEQLTEMASTLGADPTDVRTWAEIQLAGTANNVDDDVRTVGEIAKQYSQEVVADCQTQRRPGVMTGFYTLDCSIGSLVRGELVILAARPSVGKTAFAMQIAEHVATKEKQSFIVSLEMKDRELVHRMLVKHSKLDSRKIRTRSLDETEQRKFLVTGESMDWLPARVWAPARATIPQIRAIAKLSNTKRKIDFLVVDYLGLISQTGYRVEKHEHIGEAVKELKQLAKDLDIPVMACCQLNREAEGERPTLDQLRDSGQIEEHADVVLLLHRQKRDSVDAILDIAKHRNSEIYGIPFLFDGRTTTFSDPAAPVANPIFDEWNKA